MGRMGCSSKWKEGNVRSGGKEKEKKKRLQETAAAIPLQQWRFTRPGYR
jgi:hypothetical protein